jgi:AcrR family transcriptional regulator
MVESVPNVSVGRSFKAKGLATRTAILDAAHEVFKELGFYSSSISEITRRCGVSMGTFYQYFKNKEQAFLELSDLIISRFTDQAEDLSSAEFNFEQRLQAAVKLLFNHTQNNFAFIRILGESELIERVTTSYYDAIARYYRNFFRREAQSGNLRSLDPNMIAYGLIGICYFNSLEWGTTGESFSQQEFVDMIMELIMYGISGSKPWEKPAGWSLLSLPEPLSIQNENEEPMTKGEKTRQTILKAAERVLGERGINRANIAEITRSAGVAQGTFYVHFESKSDLIEGFVKFYNHKMRQELQRVVAKTIDRRDAERLGILSFLEFVRQHRKIYRIVPECEIISRDVSRWYYTKIAHGYIKGLKRGVEKGEIRNLPPIFLARSLMGLTHFIALKWIIWNLAPQVLITHPVLRDMIEFVLFGCRSNEKRRKIGFQRFFS